MESKERSCRPTPPAIRGFDGSQSIADFRIRSMMCAPLIDTAGTALGIIQIDTLDQRSRFQASDLDVWRASRFRPRSPSKMRSYTKPT